MSRAGVPHADIWRLCERGTQRTTGLLCPAGSRAESINGLLISSSHPTHARGERSAGAENTKAEKSAIDPGAPACLTLHVTTAPTSGRSWDSASLTTDTTGSCGAAEGRVSSGHGLLQDHSGHHRSPVPPPGRGCTAPAPGSRPRGRAVRATSVLTPLSSLLFSRQPASEEKMKPCRVYVPLPAVASSALHSRSPKTRGLKLPGRPTSPSRFRAPGLRSRPAQRGGAAPHGPGSALSRTPRGNPPSLGSGPAPPILRARATLSPTPGNPRFSPATPPPPPPLTHRGRSTEREAPSSLLGVRSQKALILLVPGSQAAL